MEQFNMEKRRAKLDLAEGGETISSRFSASPLQYLLHGDF